LLEKLKIKKPKDINTKVDLFAWAMQIIGMLLVHIFVVVICGILTTIIVIMAWSTKFWLMILLAIACIGICIMGLAAIVTDICNIAYLFQEQKALRK